MSEVALIAKLPSPLDYSPWTGVDFIDNSEIKLAIDEERLLAPTNVPYMKVCTKQQHIERIAYLVVHEDKKPITVFKKRMINWPVKDGNHRLAAAIYRKDKIIKVNWV